MIENCSIIVSVKSNIKVVMRFLQSLERNCKGAEIIILDNKCVERKLSNILKFKAKKNNWKLILRPNELPIPKNLCELTKYATKEYLVYPNADTVITRGSIEKLLKHLEGNIGLTLPSTNRHGDDHYVIHLNRANRGWDDNQIESFARELLTKEKIITLTKWPMGFCVAIRKSVYDEVGGWDPECCFYGGDFDLYYRLILKGYKLAWVKHAYVHHFSHTSTKKLNANMQKLEENKFMSNKYGFDWKERFVSSGYIGEGWLKKYD